MLWKLRFFGKINIIRKTVKYIFSWVFRHGRTIIIPFGPISGFKWFCDKDHQFWMPLGLYEQETATWIIESLKRGGTFIDIGANAGYFTLIGSKCVGRDGQVFLFEPIPKNINVIKKHLQLNKIENVAVKEMAVSSKCGKAKFSIELVDANSHLEDVDITHADSKPINSIIVETTTLDNFINKCEVRPNVIKVDVEGAEKQVLLGAINTLGLVDVSWIISTHSEQLFKDCQKIMIDNGYIVESLHGFHHELICYK